MSALPILRLAGGRVISRCMTSHQPLLRTAPGLACIIPKKNLALISAVNKRIYGPQEAEEKERDDTHWLRERYVARDDTHWLRERYVPIALIPLIPGALDTALCSAMVLHSYWRLSGVAEDYIHGQILPKIAQPTVKILTILAFGSLCYFNCFDVGFAQAVHQLYTQL